MYLFCKDQCIDICCKNTSPYVRLAAEDLKKDFARVSTRRVTPLSVDSETDWCIVIEENYDADGCEPLKNEWFHIKSENQKIIISAGGYLGTMWGIYTFSQRFLNVDPCYLFNDLEPQKVEKIEVGNIDLQDEPKSFGFRGIFINDEDLLTGWKDGGGMRYTDYPFYGVTVEEGVMDMIVETVLRLRLNLVIPASLLDIDNPPEKKLADCVAKRGIFLSQHHIEPVGVSAFTFQNYLKQSGETGNFSYITHPELMKKIWTFYAKKWSEYEHVVWQIGLRGKGDRPVWQDASPTESELRYYGDIISEAMQCQKEIILKATNGKAKFFTSTLWMEGSMLMEHHLIDIPDDVMTVFSDTGPNQMFGPDFYSVPRKKGKQYGIYYHVQYIGDGPHLAPLTGLDKLFYNIKLAYDKGDVAYCILNISNVREFTFEIGAYAQMLWNINTFSKQQYLERYAEQFGTQKSPMLHAIKNYYNAVAVLDTASLGKHLGKYFYYDLSHHPDEIKNFVIKDGLIGFKGYSIIKQFGTELDNALYRETYDATASSISKYRQVCDQLTDISNAVSPPIKRHIEATWLCYANTMRCLYGWYANLYEAKQYYDNRQSQETIDALLRACELLETLLAYRTCAEYGKFQNWYRGDLKINVQQLLTDTKRLLGRTAF